MSLAETRAVRLQRELGETWKRRIAKAVAGQKVVRTVVAPNLVVIGPHVVSSHEVGASEVNTAGSATKPMAGTE